MSKKGKRIYLIIIWVITLAVIIFGTYRFVGNGLDWIFSFGGGDAVTKTVDLSPDVSEINVEVKSANVLIQEGDTPGVVYTFPEKANINLTQENGVLRLSQDKDSNVVSFGKSKKEVVITLPREKSLARVNVKTKSGTIELNGTHCDDVVVNADELTEKQLAQIQDIVTRKTGYSANKIRISPLKQK